MSGALGTLVGTRLLVVPPSSYPVMLILGDFIVAFVALNAMRLSRCGCRVDPRLPI